MKGYLRKREIYQFFAAVGIKKAAHAGSLLFEILI
jgi:hypothetical protein